MRTPQGVLGLGLLLSGFAAGADERAPPVLAGRLVGAPAVVLDTRRDACAPGDIPDTNARALRDETGAVHLFASHFTTRASVGPTLETVTHRCEVVLQSALDAEPAHFRDRSWLASLYSLDGRRVAALLHNEYRGWEHAGMCTKGLPAQEVGRCWYNNIGFAQSLDGARSFRLPGAPEGGLVAAMPFPYDKETEGSAVGYYGPSNIVRSEGYYYALINAWPNALQHYGACLIRTADVFDPRSWRGWDGTAFGVVFADPYAGGETGRPVADAAAHICKPVYRGNAQSLTFHQASGTYVVSEFTPDSRFGEPGLYLTGSRDLIHWGKPARVATRADIAARDGGARAAYNYFALIDPRAPDRNFTIITDTPSVFYVRRELDRFPAARILFRQALQIEVGPN